jgi:mono/diheme cytochrome c family protein
MMSRVGRSAVIVAVVLAVVSAPTMADDTNGGAPDPQIVEKGKALYYRHCVHCHGINMVNPGTVSFDLRQFPRDDRTRFVQSVTRGKNDRMPPWGDVLSGQEIDALWAYVRTGGQS